MINLERRRIKITYEISNGCEIVLKDKFLDLKPHKFLIK